MKIIVVLEAKKIIENTFGDRIRIRVCGVYEENGKFLLANHLGINENGDFWCPPGGGVDYGEKIEAALKREFFEECCVKIELGSFLETFEYIGGDLHAIELFFKIVKIEGPVKLGHDPETGNQVLKALKWFTIEEITQLKKEEIHSYFHQYLNNNK